MRDHLLFYLNGERREVRGPAAFLTLSEWLRDQLRLVGTKVVCAEGDCGACTVLVGRPSAGGLEYRAIDSCIAFVHQLDGSHVVTVEGLARGAGLHPVQQAMVDGYGSQCGFCTPGMVMALVALLEERAGAEAGGAAPPVSGWAAARRSLAGNLCRCTGYWQILESACALDPDAVPRLAALYPESRIVPELIAAAGEPVRLEAPPAEDGSAPARRLLLAGDLDAACRFKLEHPGCQVVAGATDIAVRRNKGAEEPPAVLALGPRIAGFDRVTVENGVLRAGAGVTWAQLLPLAAERVPELERILERFGASQIRNAATLGGNLANASPIADSLPFLYVSEATLVLRGPEGERRVAIESFYRGYKDLDLGPGELIAGVEVPLPEPGDVLRLYKMSRRRALDIASFTAGVLLRLEGGSIVRARLAYGGVGPVVLRLPRTESYLHGRPLTIETMRAAGEIAAEEITPWSDVRGSEAYRRRLAETVLLRALHDIEHPAPPPGASLPPLDLDLGAGADARPGGGNA